MKSRGIHRRALRLDDVKIRINITTLKIAVLKWHPGLPGAVELRLIKILWDYDELRRDILYYNRPAEPSFHSVHRPLPWHWPILDWLTAKEMDNGAYYVGISVFSNLSCCQEWKHVTSGQDKMTINSWLLQDLFRSVMLKLILVMAEVYLVTHNCP